MTGRVKAVFDTTALLAHVAGVAPGELLAEIADEHNLVAVPAVCLAEAHADTAGDEWATAQLDRLVTADAVKVLPLDVDRAREVGHYAARLGMYGGIAIGAAVQAALEFEAYYATAAPKVAARILPPGWPILDLSE